MDINDYKSNSFKSKEEQAEQTNQKKFEKVVQGTAKTKQKSGVDRLANSLISEDVKDVKSYIFMDILIPSIKKVIVDIVSDGIEMIMYGKSGRNRKGSTASKISYRSYYDRRENDRPATPRAISRYDYDDIVLDNRGEAEDVLSRMIEAVEEYGVVSVADLYDLVGMQHNFTDNKYGWTSLRTASVERTRDGYWIKLPKAQPV